ncbi:hypothetical protein LNV09_14210 [Paucibacter sp. B2R-40]|uniref:hypothetical protein n=1 Tax=Paucibacter sp. B2R-40 TaxID=2893554 RepID=UPI0021E3CD1B|nr:hypothetical protein [Paucibacter sp. B2R-40]MCV2355304.1 hypothetical protein [Paucibacter sp. B2R-40]
MSKLLWMSMIGLLLMTRMAWATPEAVSNTPEPVELIIWLKADASRSDPILSFIAQKLPQVRHEYLSTNSIRSWHMIQHGEPACRSETVRTAAREKEAYFVDTQLTPHAELLVRRDKLALVPRNSADEVDLALLLKRAQLWGAIVRGRSYGDFVDGVLAQQPRGPYLADYATQGFGERLQDMLVKGRADFWIDVSGALIQMQARGLPIDDFIALAIQGAPRTLQLSIACPRTPWGLAASRAIDQVLGTPEGAAHLQKASAGYFDPEALKRLGPQIEQFYQRRSKPQFAE